MSHQSTVEEVTLYGSKISYFTGKVEGYLRYKGIPYDFKVMTAGSMPMIEKATGAGQMPAVLLKDGRWMTDSSVMIDWFEKEQWGTGSVLPQDAVVGFVSKLIEDYGDEYMWRAAMHYRWSYQAGYDKLGSFIANEILRDIPLPFMVRKKVIQTRQHRCYVLGDGVSSHTKDHVEAGYLTLLSVLEGILSERPFVLGPVPTLADFGLFASLFRHFSEDPNPSSIMRSKAPAVYQWVQRMFSTKATPASVLTLQRVDVLSPLSPLLKEVCETHIVQLVANAKAYKQGSSTFSMTCQGVTYTGLPVSKYRVWCLEQLQLNYTQLSPPDKEAVKSILQQHDNAWDLLWSVTVSTGYNPSASPFCKGIKTFESPRIPSSCFVVAAAVAAFCLAYYFRDVL